MLSKKIEEWLQYSGIVINGPHAWDIQVNDRRWFRRVFLEKNLGLGESYMDGWWDCRRIDEMINHLLRSGIQNEIKGGLRYLLHFLPGYLYNLQTKTRSHIIAKRHYDLDNDLFLCFLDPHHQYRTEQPFGRL